LPQDDRERWSEAMPITNDEMSELKWAIEVLLSTDRKLRDAQLAKDEAESKLNGLVWKMKNENDKPVPDK
jgi:hypothetical protein